MPYATNADLPATVRSKLKGKKLRQWRHVFNSAYDRHGDESRAFAEAWATVKKADTMTDFNFFLPIAKINRDKRTVSGYASTPTRDSDGEVVTLEAIKAALPGYMTYGNIREMHALKAVGVAEEANLDQKGLFLTARIVDDQAWQKCLEGVYKGFSIGGRKLAKSGNSITKLEMTEVSVVDRPSNPDCRITIAKAKKTLGSEGYLLKAKVKLPPEQKALAKMATIVESLAKSPPAGRDGFSLPAVEKKDNVSPKDESTQNNKASVGEAPTKCAAHGVVDCEKCKLEKDLTLAAKPSDPGPDFASDDSSGAGASEPKDTPPKAEKREFSSKERENLADTGEALPDGSYPIKTKEDLSNAIQAFGRAKDKGRAKAHIKRRARALGATDMLPEGWSKAMNKAAKRLAKARLNAALGLTPPSFLTLEKGMRTVGGLSYCFDSLRDAQRSLMLEGQREGGDKKDQALAKELGSIAKQLAGIIGQKASHEAQEAEGLTDVDDQFLNSILGEGDMAQKATDTHGDPLTDAMAALMKRAATPTRAQLLGKAQDDVKESRKAMKECRKALEEAHKMHKAAFLAKAAKGGKKPPADDDADDFDHAGAMEKLQKAYGDLEKARTFGKAALGKIAKAAESGIQGRSGQRGEEVSDGQGKFYEVPAGVKDLSPRDLATASPGGPGSGGAPPLYPVDGSVYSGKVDDNNDLRKYAGKDGNISPEIAQLLMEKTAAAAELEALRRMPATPSGGRRPFNFDISKINGGGGGGTTSPDNLRKSLFEGVDVNALNGGDERAHTEASARVIGNLLTSGQFGKSVLDPSFRGAAG